MQQYQLSAPGISATFLSFGAALQSLQVKDRQGKWTDVVAGYDDPEEYTKNKTFNGAIIGRYTNRIGKGKFTIDGQDYNIPLSEGGKTALHGGNHGWDQRHWRLVSQSDSSLTLGLTDPDGSEGFPGAVDAHITYTLAANPTRLTIRIVALSLDKRTPIMPTTHTFWNLSGFADPTVVNDTLHLPNAKQTIGVDDLLVPTGELVPVASTKYLDFTSPKRLADHADNGEFETNGGGIDHAYVLESTGDKPLQLEWTSAASGIRLSIRTNQEGIQIYSGAHHDGTHSLKQSQSGGPFDKVQKFGCLAIEPQDWIDGVNHPQWNRSSRQIFGPTDGPCVNWAEYAFDTV